MECRYPWNVLDTHRADAGLDDVLFVVNAGSWLEKSEK